MSENNLLTTIDEHGRAILTMNRPELHNAFDDLLIADLHRQLKQLDIDPQVRVVILAASGKSFSAGADLNWMRRMADYSRQENLNDAMALADMLKTLNGLSKPTIALVQGAAFGGGVGLVACCDIAIAAPRAKFCLSEVKLGMIPAVISPYVIEAIGSRAGRRYALTAEIFDAAEACRLGLVHEVVDGAELEQFGLELASVIAKNGPAAVAAAKRLVTDVARGPLDQAMITDTAERIADIRSSDEGKEGLNAFLEKRQPKWLKG
jgi:methylglutaconyl-CoA hydratase